MREFHDLTAGTPLAAGAEVVCHNDLSPKNTVYRDTGAGLSPVTFIDWDIAAPGERVHDIAHVCWQYLDLGPSVADPAAASRRMRLICDAYGLADRGILLETILCYRTELGVALSRLRLLSPSSRPRPMGFPWSGTPLQISGEGR